MRKIVTEIPSSLAVQSSRQADRHYHLLDVLRGIAITFVIGHHVALRFPQMVSDPLAAFLKNVGWAGVDLFFAISGFLITGLLVKHSSLSGVKGFFIKRFFRIVPLYLIAIFLYASISILDRYELDILHRLWINLTFLTAWAIPVLGEDGVPYTISWSLSVEEFAYLTLGLFCLISPSRFRPFLWAVAGIAITIRCLVIFQHPFDPLLLYYFAPARLDSIAFGGLVALGLGASLTQHRYASPILAASLIAILFVFANLGRASAITQSGGYMVFGLLAALLVGALATIRSQLISWPSRLLAWIGKVSYFLYLFHMFVIAAFNLSIFLLFRNICGFWGLFAVSLGLTCAAAALSWRYFEEPLITHGRRIANRFSSPQKIAASTLNNIH